MLRLSAARPRCACSQITEKYSRSRSSIFMTEIHRGGKYGYLRRVEATVNMVWPLRNFRRYRPRAGRLMKPLWIRTALRFPEGAQSRCSLQYAEWTCDITALV